MTQSAEETQKFEQVILKFYPGSTLKRAWEMKGGISAQVTALEIDQPDGQTKKLVVRRPGPVDLRNNPAIAADEFKLLQTLRSLGLPVPRPYQLDQSGRILPTPYLIIEFIEGAPEFAPANLPAFLQELAAQLARIHAVDCAGLDLAFLPDQAKRYAAKFSRRPARLDASLAEGRIRSALEAVWPLPPRNKATLLHGDFWPGNILWQVGRVAAVIDWEDAEVGDPLADLGNSRLEILWAFGPEAMELFTGYYQALTPFDITNLPYWDLCAALRPASRISEWAADPITEKAMRQGHRLFINQAFARVQ
jgi:aminoglycoside phosphotransferase (APT) family kinase protein